ncbi:MAG: hypothetical protein IJB30_04580 [Clostridia bacterium]|nr:hypothetical protein [Clostridia bacterium]MBQ6703388.1 hypothetical protein [Clostridia bacterium]
MLFNLLRGHNPGLGVISGSLAGIDGYQLISIPLSVTPLMAVFRTAVGGMSEIAVYYRSELGAELTLITGGSAPASTRLYYELDTLMTAMVSGASQGNTAAVEYYILGVKKE